MIFDDEAKLFRGEVLGLKDVITFQGTSVSELEKAFSGSLCVRMSPDFHVDTKFL